MGTNASKLVDMIRSLGGFEEGVSVTDSKGENNWIEHLRRVNNLEIVAVKNVKETD